jgi:uncharacterized membrane protein
MKTNPLAASDACFLTTPKKIRGGRTMKALFVPVLILLSSLVEGFVAPSKSASLLSRNSFDPCNLVENHEVKRDDASSRRISSAFGAGPIAVTLFAALPAQAATVSAAVPNALVAYGHYFFLLAMFGLLVYERVSTKPGMTPEEEKALVIADALYGLSGALLAVTGYFRATEYGKGWEFYSHEPIFWLKLSFLGILGGLSLFPTVTLTKRGIPLFQGEKVEPMSENLAGRMHAVMNAEISALLTIPLAATMMSRGVWYNDGFPWQAGAAGVVVTLLGSGFRYAKQALQWEEDDATTVKPGGDGV